MEFLQMGGSSGLSFINVSTQTDFFSRFFDLNKGEIENRITITAPDVENLCLKRIFKWYYGFMTHSLVAK